VLADRQGCYFHTAGMIVNGQGLLFMGHSGAGKSTVVKMLMDEGEILCDDRIIARRWPEGFKVHGTWSHGEIPIVSNASAPLRAILLLEKAPANRLIPINDRGEIVRKLPFFVVKPLVTADWWEKTLDLVGQIIREVPVYRLQFDKSGQVKEVLKQLV
jgi:ABC-type cobalamin/Fe3+-siderophores transport system ATPase subunit